MAPKRGGPTTPPSADDAVVNRLSQLLRIAVAELVPESASPTVLLSGGVDSSLVASMVREANPGTEALVVGAAGSPDLRHAAESSLLLRIPLRTIEVDQRHVARALIEFDVELRSLRGPAKEVAVAVAVTLQEAKRDLVLCGQGADELFLGYAHFRGLTPGEATVRRQRDWSTLIQQDWPRAQRIAGRLGVQMRSPFLSGAFSEAVFAVPIATQLPGLTSKPLLRRLARTLGLPEALASRPKKAWQYGSGIAKLLRHASLAQASVPPG